jgi:hypothetical protein
MGLARELSMGKRRPNAHTGRTGDYALLRRLTTAQDPDLAIFRTVLERVGGQRDRMRFAEGVVYAEACERYRALSGQEFGPTIGRY